MLLFSKRLKEIRKAVKLRLDKEKIKIPYPQIEVHNGK